MDQNADTYVSPKVISYYQKLEALQKPEQTILERMRTRLKEARMLDIGVGGGRTIPYFAPLVKEYTGVDYIPGMIDACIKKYGNQFPHAVFTPADVRNLAAFNEDLFDFVLFSFNGIDYIKPEERPLALSEIKRVLKPGGFFCFSTHNLISLYNIPAFEFRLNLVSAINRYFEVKKIRRINKKQLKEVRKVNYVTINDGAHDFGLNTCYFRPAFQLSQLQEAGFSQIEAFSLSTGKNIDLTQELGSTTEKWVYFLCQKP